MEDTIVLYPAPAVGHVISMVELGKLILHHYHHYHHYSVTILIANGSIDTASTTSYIHRISETTPSISFHHLPSLAQPLHTSNRAATALDIIRLNVPDVLHALQTISHSSKVRAFITTASHALYDIKIPTYHFFSSGASALAAILYLPTMHNQFTKSFKDIPTTQLQIPGLPSIRASHMPEPLLDRDNQSYRYFFDTASNLAKSQGIIVNTFGSLEPRAIKAITDGLCVPDARIPPLYNIGPFIANSDDRTSGSSCSGFGNEAECLSWLDAQPLRSVVFLSFGSRGTLSKAQLKEIASGLEKSGQRFLWVVRSPPLTDEGKRNSLPAATEPDLDVLLPQGFLDRTKERGLVVKSWAPQAAVLFREAVGGFVTHCGWNSVLEAVCAGVPMVTWPLYAEQHINRAVLVEEMRLGMPIDQLEDGFVSATEVERRVRALMESEQGRALRDRSREVKESAVAAWAEGGSSLAAFAKLAESWKQE